MLSQFWAFYTGLARARGNVHYFMNIVLKKFKKASLQKRLEIETVIILPRLKFSGQRWCGLALFRTEPLKFMGCRSPVIKQIDRNA